MSPLSGEAKAIKGYLQDFRTAQQLRTPRYSQLEQGFARVLQSHDENQYK